MNIKDIKKDILSKAFLGKVGKFCCVNMKMFVFALFFILSGYCVYMWYIYIYNPHWSEEKKSEYLLTKDKEVTFNKKKFQEIVEREKNRAKEYEKKVENVEDIFRIK